MNLENQSRSQLRKNKLLLFAKIAALLLLFLIIAVSLGRDYFSRDSAINREKRTLPSPASTKDAEISITKAAMVSETVTPIPEELNLDVPFTSQAPSAVWDSTHEEACEEAAALMANRYFTNQTIDNEEDAEEGLQWIIDWEKEDLGFFESTTAKETARILFEFLGLKAELVFDPSVKIIKEAIAQNKLVLVPAAGQQLGNPFYKAPGPLYHFLLIKGYTADKFITNDPGTKRGKNYPYDFQAVLSANHDWNGGDVLNGQKVIILVSK
jgi:hypothetical protein